MPTCNLFETIHNIWLQKSSNKGTCFFATMFNNYVKAFRQFPLYYAFLQGGASGTNLDKNELCLCKANQFGDPIEIIVALAKYTSSFGLSIRILHLEGEEVFGSPKRKVDLPPKSEVDSHRYD
jgi:hypothetical protein